MSRTCSDSLKVKLVKYCAALGRFLVQAVVIFENRSTDVAVDHPRGPVPTLRCLLSAASRL
jgi:hypothetical protein